MSLGRESTGEVEAPPRGIVADLQRRIHITAAGSHGAELGVEVRACNPSLQEAEVGGSGGPGQPWLHGKFDVSLGYMIPCAVKNQEQTKLEYMIERGKGIMGPRWRSFGYV